MAIELELADIIRVRIASYTPSQVGINTAHFVVVMKAGVGATTQQVAETLDVALEARYKAVLSVGARYRGVSVQRVHPGGVTVPSATSDNDGPGAVAGDMLATQVSGIVSSRTDLAGPRYRGRVYIPFPGETDNQATGVPSAAYVTAIEDLAEELFTPFTAGAGGNTVTLDPVVFHRDTNSGTAITSFIARTVWATQRRRGAYGRMNLPPF
jgi:hypothetical protein